MKVTRLQGFGDITLCLWRFPRSRISLSNLATIISVIFYHITDELPLFAKLFRMLIISPNLYTVIYRPPVL